MGCLYFRPNLSHFWKWITTAELLYKNHQKSFGKKNEQNKKALVLSRKLSNGVGEFGTVYVVCTYFLIFLIKNFFIPSSSSALPSKAAQEGIFLGCLFLSTNKPEKEKKNSWNQITTTYFFYKV